MQNINFNQLRRIWNLRLVVETGSIKKAATRANVTSSALSQSISGLEESIGRKVLLRNKDALVPTEYGLELLRSANSVFTECTEFQERMASGAIEKPKMAWLDLGACESLASDVLPPLMERLRSQFPGLRLKVKTGRSAELTRHVSKGELCMALVDDNDALDASRAIEVSEERLGLFVSAEHVRRDARALIDEMGLAVLSPGPEGYPHYYSQFLRSLGRTIRPTLTSESHDLLRAAAVAGSVVAVLPGRVAARRRGELVELRTVEKGSPLRGSYKIYLVSEPDCSLAESRFLADEIKATLAASTATRV